MAFAKINQSPSNSGGISQTGPSPVYIANTSANSGSTSAQVYTPAGSGSRPVSSKFPIPTSAPTDARTRGKNQAPAGWLK